MKIRIKYKEIEVEMNMQNFEKEKVLEVLKNVKEVCGDKSSWDVGFDD